MASPSKFQGASGNLRRVFDHNQKRYRDLVHSQTASLIHKELSPHQQRIQDIKSFSIKFLHLMDILYNLGPTKPANRYYLGVTFGLFAILICILIVRSLVNINKTENSMHSNAELFVKNAFASDQNV